MTTNPLKIGDSVLLDPDVEIIIESIKGETYNCTLRRGELKTSIELRSEMLMAKLDTIGIQMVGNDEGIDLNIDTGEAE